LVGGPGRKRKKSRGFLARRPAAERWKENYLGEPDGARIWPGAACWAGWLGLLSFFFYLKQFFYCFSVCFKTISTKILVVQLNRERRDII
jgi:hypothetical protein